MNIKIIDSWLREYLDTKAKPVDIARELSLTSVSIERIEEKENDFIYDIEVTTNRPDLMSVMGIAREASSTLPQQGISAKYINRKIPDINTGDISFPIEIISDPKLVNRIMAVVMEVEIKDSPKIIQERLEASDIRSLNNVIDVTNYVMRETGHPAHVFDYDLLNTKKMIIRESKIDETLTTLDGKEYSLAGGDIIADNGSGEIIDLLGIMGTKNSVVQNNTKRILFFLDNLDPKHIRNSSMNLGIRTEAAIINEKGIDPELMEIAFKRGIELYRDIANAKVVSKILDIYPNKRSEKTLILNLDKVSNVIGIKIDPKKISQILSDLNFTNKLKTNHLEVIIPTIRIDDVLIEEDLIEEVARVYGYHKLPSVIPTFLNNKPYNYANNFYFENRIKNALKYFGFTEIYTYSLVSEEMINGPIDKAVKIKNPLSIDMAYLRNDLIPSLLNAVENNKSYEEIKIFELSNIYEKRANDLPIETQTLGLIIKKKNVSFYEAKGIVESILSDLNIKNYKFKNREEGGAEVLIGNEKIGYIELLSISIIDIQLNFEKMLNHANLKKVYKPTAKFPKIIEDITFVLDSNIQTQDVIEEIKLQSFLITEVTLKDTYENSRTFHIIYQAEDKNLTSSEIKEIRNEIINSVINKFNAQVK